MSQNIARERLSFTNNDVTLATGEDSRVGIGDRGLIDRGGAGGGVFLPTTGGLAHSFPFLEIWSSRLDNDFRFLCGGLEQLIEVAEAHHFADCV